jgi:hypothetical protein
MYKYSGRFTFRGFLRFHKWLVNQFTGDVSSAAAFGQAHNAIESNSGPDDNQYE